MRPSQKILQRGSDFVICTLEANELFSARLGRSEPIELPVSRPSEGQRRVALQQRRNGWTNPFVWMGVHVPSPPGLRGFR